jgi:hypothetical protein
MAALDTRIYGPLSRDHFHFSSTQLTRMVNFQLKRLRLRNALSGLALSQQNVFFAQIYYFHFKTNRNWEKI